MRGKEFPFIQEVILCVRISFKPMECCTISSNHDRINSTEIYRKHQNSCAFLNANSSNNLESIRFAGSVETLSSSDDVVSS